MRNSQWVRRWLSPQRQRNTIRKLKWCSLLVFFFSCFSFPTTTVFFFRFSFLCEFAFKFSTDWLINFDTTFRFGRQKSWKYFFLVCGSQASSYVSITHISRLYTHCTVYNMHIWVSFGDMQKNLNGKYLRIMSFSPCGCRCYRWLPLLFHCEKWNEIFELIRNSAEKEKRGNKKSSKKPQEFRVNIPCVGWQRMEFIQCSVFSLHSVIQFRWNRMNFEDGDRKLCSILHPPSRYAELLYSIILFY